MQIEQKIEQALRDHFKPVSVTVTDTSDQHIGHAGYRAGGQSHFELVITAQAFRGLSRVAQHRAIYAAIGPDVMSQIHALSIAVRLP